MDLDIGGAVALDKPQFFLRMDILSLTVQRRDKHLFFAIG